MPPSSPPHAEYFRSKLTWDWQDLEALMTETMKLVPPGKALRRYQSNRANAEKKNITGVKKPELSQAEQIRSGARSIVYDIFGQMRRVGQVEELDDNGVRKVRLRSQVPPGEHCPTCGHVSGTANPQMPPPEKQQPRVAKVLQFPRRAS